ncbi:hypothetical protein DV738_g3310, partial [Chaetothyriales sp. CBS 135597]
MTSSSSIPARKTPLSSLPDLKGTTDDTIPQLLTSPSWLPAAGYTFRQDHTLTNVRLALGYTSLAIAGALFYVDWKLGGWEVTRPYTLPACLAYFALNGALSFWLTLRSSIKKHEPIYRLHVTYTCSSKNPPVVYQDSDVQGRFAEWFNMYGYIDKPALKNWLAKNIDVIDVRSTGTTKRGKAKKKA